MKNVDQMLQENEQMIAEGQGGGPNAGKLIGAVTGGALGGGGFDARSQMQTSGYQNYRAGERAGYDDLQKRSTAGSPSFTKAELKRGYRKIK
jgi:hypothetical protein